MIRRAFPALFACVVLHGQTADPPVAFEVASVKVAPPPAPNAGMMVGCGGGPGTPNPGLYRCGNATIATLLAAAYSLKPYQLPPSAGGDSERYDINAKVPEGATRDQVKFMVQNLLTERFKLAFHYEKKEMPVYELSVAKNGPKLKEAAPPPPPAPKDASDSTPKPPAPAKLARDADGFPIVPAGPGTSMMLSSNGRMRLIAGAAPMERIVAMLSAQLSHPVNDLTGLTGKYDIVITYASLSSGPARTAGPDGSAATEAVDPAPSIFEAVQQQLGLKLEQKKGTIDLFVIDHVEKPSGN